MVRAYLLTYMTRQHFLHGHTLPARFPNAWFVWEPGNWKAPAYDEQTLVPAKHDSQPPGMVDAAAAMAKGDALCFALTGNGPLKVGRASTSELVINDGTVSREHLLLKLASPGQWTAERLSKTKPTTFRGQPFPLSGAVYLRDADPLGLGDITLTFYDTLGFSRRLEQEVRKQLAQPSTGTD
jgi:hypothetical protein